jgi:hypothetical protein
MKASSLGAAMVAHKSRAPTPYPAISLAVKFSIASPSNVKSVVSGYKERDKRREVSLSFETERAILGENNKYSRSECNAATAQH